MTTDSNAIAIAASRLPAKLMEHVLAKGDLVYLTSEDRVLFYTTLCQTLHLNPLTKPFEYISLNGKLTLYARKDCTDQLRKIYGVSILEMSDHLDADAQLYIVTAKGRDKNGRLDASKGAVSLKGLSGEARANAIMKAETKAKRRLTLSLCGLGMLDELETESIPD